VLHVNRKGDEKHISITFTYVQKRTTKYNTFCEDLYLHFGSNSTCNKKILVLQKKKSELWLVQNLKIHVEIYLKDRSFTFFPCEYMFSLTDFIVNYPRNISNKFGST